MAVQQSKVIKHATPLDTKYVRIRITDNENNEIRVIEIRVAQLNNIRTTVEDGCQIYSLKCTDDDEIIFRNAGMFFFLSSKNFILNYRQTRDLPRCRCVAISNQQHYFRVAAHNHVSISTPGCLDAYIYSCHLMTRLSGVIQ